VLWLVPGLALTKSKIYSGELTDKYQRIFGRVEDGLAENQVGLDYSKVSCSSRAWSERWR